MKKINFIFVFLILLAAKQAGAQLSSQSSTTFEGIVYAKTTFPGYSINELVKQIDFEKENIDKQYLSVRNTIKDQPDVVNDQMYLMALVLTPIYLKTTFTAQKSLTKMQALGYEWQTLIDEQEGKGRIFLYSHSMKERGTINFNKSELKKIWEKEEVDEYEGEYKVTSSQQTAVIAGHTCNKITYIFSGTSQGPVAHSKIISTIPWKITAWYSDEVDPRINIQNPFYFKLNKAVLKTEVEFDKTGKKKILYEVIKIERKKIDEEEFKIPELGEVVNHQPNGQEALMLIMKVMAEAGKISWQ